MVVDSVKAATMAKVCKLSDAISQRKFRKEPRVRKKSPLRA